MKPVISHSSCQDDPKRSQGPKVSELEIQSFQKEPIGHEGLQGSAEWVSSQAAVASPEGGCDEGHEATIHS